MAQSDHVIDIYDEETWNGDCSYESVLDVVHKRIASHPNQQQRVESGVKGIADQSQTGVGEERRNARLIINFMFKREHNRLIKLLKPNVKRMQSAEATAHLVDYSSILIGQFEDVETHFGSGKCKAVESKFYDKKSTQGQKESKKKLLASLDNLDSMDFGVVYKAERPGIIELTCQMGGGIELQCLSAKNNRMPELIAELIARGFKDDENAEGFNKNKDLRPIRNDIRKLKAALKQDEFERRAPKFKELKLTNIQ